MFFEIFPPYIFFRRTGSNTVDLYQIVSGHIAGMAHSLSPFACLSISDRGDVIVSVNQLNNRVEILYCGEMFKRAIPIGNCLSVAPIASSPPMIVARDRQNTCLFVFDERQGDFYMRTDVNVPIYPNLTQNSVVNQGCVWETVEGKTDEIAQYALLKTSPELKAIQILPASRSMVYTRTMRCTPQWVDNSNENGAAVYKLSTVYEQNVVTIAHDTRLHIWFARIEKSGMVLRAFIPGSSDACSLVVFYPYGQSCPDWIIPVSLSAKIIPHLDGDFLYIFDLEKYNCLCWDVRLGYIATIGLLTFKKKEDSRMRKISDYCLEVRDRKRGQIEGYHEMLYSVVSLASRKKMGYAEWNISVGWNKR